MAYPVHNQQADAMTLFLANGTQVNLPGNGDANAGDVIDRISYHQLTYDRVGGWVVADGTQLTASYAGGQNVYLTTPQHFEVVYHYNGP